jgi:hypothetical protein
MGSVITECLKVERHLQSSTSLVSAAPSPPRRNAETSIADATWCRASRRRLWPRRRASSRSTPSRCARQLSLRVMLCRTSATCQRDDEYELALANPEQLRVRGRLRQVARDRGAAALCGVLGCWRAPAPTGVLLGGSTLHSLLGSQRAKSAVNVDEDDGEQAHDRSTQGRARGAVDARHGAAVDAGRDRQVLARCSRTSLGQQLKPIANKSLASAMPCELWLRFTSAVFLRTDMRAAADPICVALLDRMPVYHKAKRYLSRRRASRLLCGPCRRRCRSRLFLLLFLSYPALQATEPT